MAGVRRINYSKETLDSLALFANYQGHGNLSAALATVVKFGVPLLMQGAQAPSPAGVWVPALEKAEVALPSPPLFVEQESETNIDPTIARLSLLLDDWS